MVVGVRNNSSSTSPTNTSGTRRELESDHTWYWTARIVITVVTVLGNSIVIGIIASRRRLRTKANWYIFSLAVADLSVGLFITPTGLICAHMPQNCEIPVQVVFYNFLLLASMGNLLAMTMDRYVAVIHPLAYHTYLTESRTALMIALAWMAPFFASSIRLFWLYREKATRKRVEGVYRVLVDVLFGILPCLIMVAAYLRILLAVNKHRVRAETQLSSVSYNSNQVDILTTTNSMRQRQRLQNKSSVKVLGVVVLFFVSCYSMNMYSSICAMFDFCTMSYLSRDISLILVFTNSAVNFFVYAMLKTDFRNELKEVLQSICHLFLQT